MSILFLSLFSSHSLGVKHRHFLMDLEADDKESQYKQKLETAQVGEI